MFKLFSFLLVVLLAGSLKAQSDVSYLNVSLWNPVALSPYKYDNSTLISVGVLQSKVNNLTGLSLNLVSGVTTGRMNGLQVSGLHSRVEGASKGVSLAGLYNVHRASMSGFVYGGIATMNLVNHHGVQFSSVQNICMFNSDGVQLAGLMNVTGQTMSGVQLAGGFNVANINRGVQLAGIVNFALEDCQGVQIAGFNYATAMHGLQLGAANFARRMKGVQVGIVNYSADSSTLKVGFVSISPKTRIQPILFGSNRTTYNVGFRFMNSVSYSILGLGTPFEKSETTSSGLFFYRLGVYQNIGFLRISTDIGTSFISQYTTTGEKNSVSLEGRVNLEVALTKKFSIIGSGGYSDRRFFARHAKANLRPIVEVGVVLPNLLKTTR